MKKIILAVLLFCFIFLRFWDLENRMQFTWDQVQNAWVMKDVIVENKMPVEGMAAKLNSPIRIGPLYYYLLVPFYWVFDLDPIAAAVFAGVVALFTFLVLFVVAKKLFSYETALVAIAVYTFSAKIIIADRIAWPVIFLPMLGLLAFYSLIRIVEGNAKFLLLLGTVLGFSLHVHFTAIFLFMYVFLCLPFMIKKKYFWKYACISTIVFLFFLTPIAATWMGKNSTDISSYVETYYHGFHFVRVFQLLGDAMIEFNSIIGISTFKFLSFLILPLFIFLRRGLTAYLVAIWFAVPLIIFSLYSGEISDYYFIITRPIAVLIFAYLTICVWNVRAYWLRGLLCTFWIYVLAYNMDVFFSNNFGNHVPKLRLEVQNEISRGSVINFTEGDPKSYLYYLYAQYKK